VTLRLLGGRPVGRVLRALVAVQHYRALLGVVRTCPTPATVLRRYLSKAGEYPCSIRVRTPIGQREARLFVRDDVLTFNEIFCREDYPAGPSVRVVVDIGSNIGLSALYFLTRNTHSRCYLFEPVPVNVERLQLNLAGLEDRYVLSATAVAATNGMVEFGIEATGRYGGIGLKRGDSIRVRCEHINDVLERVLQAERMVDVLKIDTEGQELRTLAAIDPALLARLGCIFVELSPTERTESLEGFHRVRDGTTWRFYNKRQRNGT